MTNPIETLKQLGMRQADIARELGVTPGHVQRMGDGERPLSKAHLVKLRSLITARVSALKKVIRQIHD
jgi:plasmid maintenance system antidote protein VapI